MNEPMTAMDVLTLGVRLRDKIPGFPRPDVKALVFKGWTERGLPWFVLVISSAAYEKKVTMTRGGMPDMDHVLSYPDWETDREALDAMTDACQKVIEADGQQAKVSWQFVPVNPCLNIELPTRR